MKHLREFQNHSSYDSEKSGIPKAYVATCLNEGHVHYGQIEETMIVAKFNVTSTTTPTKILYYDTTSYYSKIEIDGVEQEPIATSYTFNTIGIHTVKYEPNSSMAIGFGYLPCLISLSIPNGITTINQQLCRGSENITSVTIPDSVTTIGNSSFNNCYSLTGLTIPNGVTKLENWMFSGSGVRYINLPDSITYIEYCSMQYCYNLTEITIPSGVTKIENASIRSCNSIEKITILATTPPTLGKSNFTNTNNCPIYVPAQSVEAYKAASGWSTFTDRIQAIP